MKKTLVGLNSIFICLVGLLFISQPAWAVKPIILGVDSPVGKVGEIGRSGDTYSPGHHSIVSYGADLFAVWVQGSSSTMDVVMSQTYEGNNLFLQTQVVMKDESYPCGPSIAVTDHPTDPAKMIVHVVWTTQNNEVKYSRSIRQIGSDSPFETPVLLSTPENGVNWGATIAADNSGNVYVAWHSKGEEYIYLNRSSDSGATWDGSTLIYASVERDLLPSIAVDDQGSVHLTWETTPGVGYSRSDDHGLTWTPAVIASEPTAGHGNWPSIASNNGTDIYISWYASGLHCSHSHDGGLTWQQSSVSSQNGFSSAAVNSSGEITIVHEAPGSNIYLFRSRDNGNNWEGPQFVDDGNCPHVTMDQNDKAVLFFTYWGEIAAFTREF